jgi:hypothetical protein
MFNNEEFLKDLSNVAAFNWSYINFGECGSSLSGNLIINGSVEDIYKRYPEVDKEQLRRGCLVLLKCHMAEWRKNENNSGI